MTAQGPETIAFLLTLALMGVGLVGAAVPLLPGTVLIFAAALAHRMMMGPAGAEWWVIITLGVLTVISYALDIAGTAYGAKRYGATWRGMLGAFLGLMAGSVALPPFGIILGPIAGAALGEALGGREMKAAIRAGVGSVFGLLLAGIVRVVFSLAMIALWVAHMAGRGVSWR